MTHRTTQNPVELLRDSLRAEYSFPKEVIDKQNLRGVEAWAAQHLPTLALTELKELLSCVKSEIKKRPHETDNIVSAASKRKGIHRTIVRDLHAGMLRFQWEGERLTQGEVTKLIARSTGKSERQIQRDLSIRDKTSKKR